MHGVIAFSFLTVIVGVVALAVAATAARHSRDSYHRSYLAFLSAFTASVLLYLVAVYVDANVSQPSVGLLAAWGVVDGFVDLAVVVTSILFFHALYEIRYGRVVVWPIIGVSAALFVVFFLSGWRAVVSESRGVPRPIYIVLGYYYGLFAYVVALNLVKVWELRGVRKRVFGYGLFAFLLVGAIESVASMRSLSTRALANDPLIALIPPRSFYVSIVPYLLWCVVSTAALWRTANPGATVKTAGAPDLERYCSRYGITARERDVLVAIAKGLSNQEIADRLFISLQTVKTHAHHLYQKTGTPGRTALLASIQSFD